MRRLQGSKGSRPVKRGPGGTEMARICNRESCGKRIVAKDGSPDYRKHFCSPACLRSDKRERLLAKRERVKTQRCSQCGRKPVPNTFSNGRVKLHNAPADASAFPVGAQAQGPHSRAWEAVSRGAGASTTTE